MQVTIDQGASWTSLTGDPLSLDVAARALDKPLSFEVPGAMWAPSYQARVWDGRQRLVKKIRGGGLTFPAGLTAKAVDLIRAKGLNVDLIDSRPALPPMAGDPAWAGPPLRDYQLGAVQAVLAKSGGTIRLPIRAGKTMTAAWLISKLQTRAIFVVPSEPLLQQTRSSFEACLPGLSITCLGDGERDTSGDIVVATIQALAVRIRTKDFAAIQKQFGLCIIDEFHHVTGDGESWRDAVIAIQSRFKVGLSATIGLDTDTDGNDLWLEGIAGPIVYSVDISDLIRRGYLVQPTVYFLRHNAPPAKGKWTTGKYGDHIVQCPTRNDRIVAEAVKLAGQGHRVLIDVSQVRHGKELARLLRSQMPARQLALLVGQSDDATRRTVTAGLRAGTVRVLVSTIMGEGVDVPEIDVVINAEGGRGEIATIQRLRNLTLCPGKTRAIVIELVDDHHKQLKEWTAARLRTYRAQPAFKIRVEPATGSQWSTSGLPV